MNGIVKQAGLVFVALMCLALVVPLGCEAPAQEEAKDTDGDGLLDHLEREIGTNPHEVDTDGDGLPDYEEHCKYRTDPAKADSDGDGIPDNDWDERREYSHTIKAKCSIVYPYDLETMSDLFQDARMIEETGDTLTYEVILYPNTKPVITPYEYPIDDLPAELGQYTSRTTLFNYSYEMQQEIEEIVGDCGTDLEVAEALISWVQENTSMPIDNSGAVNYRYGVRDGEVVRENNGWLADELRDWSEDRVLATFVFGDSMFRNRTHGTCGSAAILVCTMLRAAGIPARIAVSVPIHYKPGWFIDHSWNEVYIGGKWIRADAWRGVNVPMLDPYTFVKVIAFEDYEHVNLASTWGTKYQPPSEDRPYATYECEEQDPVH